VDAVRPGPGILATVPVLPATVLRWLAQPPVMLPYYHMISDAPVAHVKHLYAYKTIQAFTQDLDFLMRRYRPVGLAEIIAALDGVAPLPAGAFHLSFDDGFREMHDIVAPILHRKGIPATFFVSSAFVDNRSLCYLHQASVLHDELLDGRVPAVAAREIADLFRSAGIAGPLAVKYGEREILLRAATVAGLDFNEYLREHRPYLTTEQLAQLHAHGFTLGAHSIDHPLYCDLTAAEQLRQTSESVKYLRNILGLSYAAFAFPHSDTGVAGAFFARLYSDGLLQVSFGTSGIMTDSFARNLQRISFEKPLLPASRIVRYHLARRVYNYARGRRLLIRH
jgi:peptidoglycan/xylan/chitin deacetylase (PgdA/CDA1 family)